MTGSFRRSFEGYQRSEKALVLAIMEMYVEGRSTRKVRDITEALCGLEIGKSQVSTLAQKLDEEIRQWRERPIDNSYPYLMINARYEKVRRGGEVISQGVLIAMGISAQGMREVLGVWVADSESEASCGEVFSDPPEPHDGARKEVCARHAKGDHRGSDAGSGTQGAGRSGESLGRRASKAAALLDTCGEEILAVY